MDGSPSPTPGPPLRVRVQREPFDYGAECAAFAAAATGTATGTTAQAGVGTGAAGTGPTGGAGTRAEADAGAVVTFAGLVRGEGGRLTAMEIEHYPAMTARALEAIRARALARWDLADALVIHRFGRLEPGEVIMMVATAARHRQAAFAAAEFLMDYLKSRAPFWKKEHGPGATGWVAARDSDEAALDRWDPQG